MTVLVDEAIWPWRGLRWAHLVSDESYDELHHLAHQIGMPYRAFQGDHYDVHEDLRLAAIEAGAVPTPSRALLRALKSAGLRRRGPLDAWQWHWWRPLEREFDTEQISNWLSKPEEPSFFKMPLPLEAPQHLRELVAQLPNPSMPAGIQLGVGQRRSEVIFGVHSEDRLNATKGALRRYNDEVSLHYASGERGTFIELLRVSARAI